MQSKWVMIHITGGFRRWLFVQFLAGGAMASLLGGCAPGSHAGSERLTHRADPKAVQEVLAGERRVASAAWWGFDERDATDSLQAAIRSGAGKLVVPNLGKPWIVRPLFLESDQEIVFEDGAVIMALQGAFLGKGDSLLTARDKDNITLCGPGASLVMRKQDYRQPPYAKAEWRNCLSLRGCRNVKVQGLRLASSGGDGIYIGRGTGERIACRDITIEHVTCEDHYRQGISVITAENLLIEGCTLAGTEGTNPQAGIDFEPNHPDELLVNCVLRGCDIQDNAGYGILMYFGALRAETEPLSITIEQCRVRDNGRGALAVIGAEKAGELRGTVRLRENQLVGKQTWSRLKIETED